MTTSKSILNFECHLPALHLILDGWLLTTIGIIKVPNNLDIIERNKLFHSYHIE